MIKSRYIYTIILTLVLLSLLSLHEASAAVTLPWSTTYDCADWTQTDGLRLADMNCDGMHGAGSWTCDNGDGSQRMEQITVSANNPDGGGGKGQRHWEGDGYTNNSGGVSVVFNTPQTELWVRWYLKFEEGYKWDEFIVNKLIYIFATDFPDKAAIVDWYFSDGFAIIPQAGDGNPRSCSNCGWATVMGGTTADGLWHEFEVHIEMDTDGTDGVAEAWIDGAQVFSFSDVDYGTSTGWAYLDIGSNQIYPGNGRCMTVDFDDISINNTNYIGPIGDIIAPGEPTTPTPR